MSTTDCGDAKNMLESMATDSHSSNPANAVLNSFEKFSQLSDDWDKTEKWIKEGELFVGKAILSPSINELRYAGRRLVDVIRAAQRGDDERTSYHFSQVQDNLVKARHDVVDAVVMHISEKTNKYRESIGAGNLKTHFSGYEELFGLLKTINQKITCSRGNRENRDTIYGEILNSDFKTLRKLYDQLIASLPAIEQKIQAENTRQNQADLELKTNRKIWIRSAAISWLIAIIAVTIAVFK